MCLEKIIDKQNSQDFVANKKFNIVLVNPNIFGDPLVPGSYRKAKIPSVSLGIASLASYIEHHSNYQVYILDTRIEGFDPLSAFKKIQKLDPDVIGLSLCSHESCAWSLPFIKLLKNWKKSIHICLGNYFASLFPDKALTILEEADSVIIGEGESSFLQLLNQLEKNQDWKTILGIAYRLENGQIKVNERRPLISDINTLPPPKRSLLKNDGDLCEMVVEGTRGCAFRCSFCTIGPFYGFEGHNFVRQKSAITIFKEVKQLCDIYPKLRRIRFVDPEFFIGSGIKRINELSNLFINNLPDLQICVESRASSIIHNFDALKLFKEAGLVRVNMGIESGSEKILKKMNKCSIVEDNIKAIKILRDLDIDYSYGFMMITPWSLDEDIEKNIDILKKIGKIELHKFFHELTLIPKTLAFQEMEKENKLIWKGELNYYTYVTESKRIERYRKLASLMEKNHNDFFKRASFLYESIRALYLTYKKALADNIEQKSDRLFLDIFMFFWEAANEEIKEEEFSFITSKCFDLYSKKLDFLLKNIDPQISLPITSNLLPKHATICQV